MFAFSLILVMVVCAVIFAYNYAKQLIITREKQRMLAEVEKLDFIPYSQKKMYRQIMSVPGRLLSVARAEKIVIQTINEFKFDGEKIITINDVKQLLQKDAVSMEEFAQTPAGQCMLGSGEKLVKDLLPSLPYSEEIKKELLNSCGYIYYNVAAIVSAATIFKSNNESGLRNMTLFFMGHERRHAAQSQRYLRQGRLSQLSNIANNGLMDAVVKGYCLIASEEDADRAGYQFMMQNFKK